MSFVSAGQGGGIGALAKMPRSLEAGGFAVLAPAPQVYALQLFVPDFAIHFCHAVQLVGREVSEAFA